MTSIWWAGLVAGFVATVVLSLMMLMKQAMGLMPEFDMIGMLGKMMGGGSRAVGWLIHFMIGTVVYGLIFAWLAPVLWGDSFWLKGMILAVIGWLMMMIILMPMGDKGFFGMKIGIMVPIMAFILHLIFGAVLGWSYGWLTA